MTRDDAEIVAYGDHGSNNIYTKFVPYGAKDPKSNNYDNDIFYYYNEVKRSGKDKNVEQLKKLFGQ